MVVEFFKMVVGGFRWSTICLSLRLRHIIKTDSVQSSSNTCKNLLVKIYSQHGNFLNAI